MESTNQIFLIGDTTYQRIFDRNNEANMIRIETPEYFSIKEPQFTIYN
ncbi:MAG: hypothetical protein ACTSPA_02315 [Promethearchaeota archaeon]